MADQRDNVVDVGHRDGEAGQHMGPVACLAELEDRAPADDLLAEGDEGDKNLLQVEQLRLALIQCQHVDAEAGLQRRVAVELIEHDFGLRRRA